MYRSVLRDILYLKVSGSSFGGKTYDNCKNAMYGIQQIVGSCWFNSTINGFLLSEYSRILFLQKLKEYLKTHKITLDKTKCPLLNKGGIYHIIYNVLYLNNKPDLYVSSYLEKSRKEHGISSLNINVEEDGGRQIDAVTKILDILSFKYFIVHENINDVDNSDQKYSDFDVENPEEGIDRIKKNYTYFKLTNLFKNFDKHKKDVDFYIYTYREIISRGKNRYTIIPLRYKNNQDNIYSLDTILFHFGKDPYKTEKENNIGHAITIFRCNNIFYLNDSNLSTSYPLHFDRLNMVSILKELINVYKEHEPKYYTSSLENILTIFSFIGVNLIYAKELEYVKYTEVSQEDKEYLQDILFKKIYKLDHIVLLHDDDFSQLSEKYFNVLNDTKEMNGEEFQKYKKNILQEFKEQKEIIMNSVFDNDEPEFVEIRERYKNFKLKKFYDKNKKNYVDDTILFLVVSMLKDDLSYKTFNRYYKMAKAKIILKN